jgi:hypothetical protein
MVIKHNQAVSTPTYKEFRCLGAHSEWYLYEARLVDGMWKLITRPAGKVKEIDEFKTLNLAFRAAYQHAA